MRLGYGEEPAEPQETGPFWGWRAWVAKPRSFLASMGVVIAAGLVVGYVLAALVFFPSQGSPVVMTEVPQLVGRDGRAASRSLERLGLTYLEGAAIHHPEVLPGSVVAQDPLAGQMVQPGATVRVTLSLGRKQRPVPDVLGLSQHQAETALQRAGFRTELALVDAEADVGEVVATEPEPGTPLRLPSTVRLLVSAGPPRVLVPDVVTRSLPEARAVLERLGLQLGVVVRDSTSLAAPGTVIAQSPDPGVVVDRATGIVVTVAIAPPPLEPPDRSGRMEETADDRSPG